MDSYALRRVSELPAPFRATFNFRYFNSLQSECFPACFLSDVNMVISAPTGSGKTVLFELCILRLLSRFLSDGRFVHAKGTLKTIYIAPSKALVQEKLRDWNLKFGSWGIVCLELTSDSESYNIKNIEEADIILTTPEKFDAVTRYSIKDGGLSFFSDIALLLIDEVHLLNDPRGAALEAIVSRMKMLACRREMKLSPLAHLRFTAASATIPNLEDLAEWLMVPLQGMKRFGEEMRPIKLTTKVFGYAAAKNDFLFEKRLQNYIFDILMQYSRRKSALVFCSTRKGAQEAAQRICQAAMTLGHSNPFIKAEEQQERLREASLSCSDKQLQSYIVYGVGYHNSGLCLKDRHVIESLFLSGDIQVLCTTNTLAHGVNLPAHTVVIKSTQQFNKEKGRYMEYDRSTILQMCGRAGRPPFDDTGMVIIMTRRDTVHLYENLLNGCETVESQLLHCMTEHLTAEIVQLTVPDITRAIEWMKCSYLYVRMKKNPENYAVRKGTSIDRIERHMQEICVQKVNELARTQMIWTDEDGFLLKPLEPGRLMTKYYLKFDTMKYIMQTDSNCSLEDILHIVCRAEELSWIQLRRNEKKLLNDINVDKAGRLRFHILGDKGKRIKRIQTREEKIFVLANDCLTGDPLIHDLSLGQDTNSICSNGCRIAKCVKEYFIYKKNYKGALNSIILAKSLYHKLWDDSPYLLKQLPGIGTVTAKALHSMGIISFEALAEADPRRIEIVTGRKYPFGNHIKESLHSLPAKVEMKVEVLESQRQGNPKLSITLTRLSKVQTTKRHYADMIFCFIQGQDTVNKSSASFKEQDTLNESSASFKGQDMVNKFDQDMDSMPSFNLLDEQLEAGLIASEVKEDDCKILTGRTVFDHIRKKSKDFPVLMASDAVHFPSSEVLKLPRKRVCGKQLELHDMIEVSEEIERDKKPEQIIVAPFTQKRESEPIGCLIKEDANHAIMHHIITKSPYAINLVDDEGENHAEMEADTKESRNEDTIFDHMRKKAKNLPMIDESNIDSDSVLPTEEIFSRNPLELASDAINTKESSHSCEPFSNTVIILDSEPNETMNNASVPAKDWKGKHSLSSRRFSNICRSLDLPLEIISNESGMPSPDMADRSRPLSNKDLQLLPPGTSMEPARWHQQSWPSEADRQSCSPATASKTRTVDSFLGFKSVFSFL
ncbi:hypothetical protein Nepgr_026721 [Nepenthes gracilis]|uniref:DNA 3'-5' helicase n=1 Tax=Nepenthes gracilis TaxID=150966 RepID=A0AAD3T8R8_NEPGR|nr:hypothetical protein Nepgr_026721 [Nepenthes gracilis]